MGERKAIPAEARWINSDAQILGKMKRSPHKQGTLCSVTMPWGDECQAVLEKVDAKSAADFCEHVRSTYNARRDEQEAKKAQRAVSEPDATTEPDDGEKLTSCEVSATAPEKAVEVDFTDQASVAARVDQIRDREAVLNAESNRLRIERTKLLRILDVLKAVDEEEANAPQDDAETV